MGAGVYTLFCVLTISSVYCIRTRRRTRNHQFDDLWITNNVVDDVSGVSTTACAVRCATSTNCQSFSYHVTDQHCQLHSLANFVPADVTTKVYPGAIYFGSLLDCSGANRIYNPIEDICVEVVTSSQTWHTADSTCKSRGGRLVVVDTEGKFNFLKTTLQGSAAWRSTNYWIGLSDETVANGVFIWSDGTQASYTNWMPNEGKSTSEYCVEMVRSHDYQWNDNPCWAALRFICEYTTSVV
ncbi:brevican core protein-like [Haliotis rufescens]|uniref:brevican core protein-like n=1 Tax=Haliotis rufescens TaxID=6454 RepID=UPI00201E8A7E|nr:brevican core protein-like [Haliotis rufescens]